MRKPIEMLLFLLMLMSLTLPLTGVISRNFLGFSLPWIEELGLVGIVWLIFIGAMIANWNGMEIKVTYFREKFLAKFPWLIVLMDLITFIATVSLVVLSIPVLINGMSYRSAVLLIPRSLTVLPVTIALISFAWKQGKDFYSNFRKT